MVLLKLGYCFIFSENLVKLFYNDIFYGCGFMSEGFMVLDTLNCINDNTVSFSLFATPNSLDVDANKWHARLGHIGQERMNRLAREGLLGPVTKIDLPICEHCLAGKTTRKPFSKAIRAEVPLQLVHSDICGPMNVRARK